MAEPEQPPPAEYFPGDEIRIRVSITSSSTIDAVEVVYAHPDYPWITLTLEGSAELGEGSHPSGPGKRSVATISGVPEYHHAPGVYEVARVVFYTFTGLPIVYDREERGLHDLQDLEADEVRALPGHAVVPGRWPTLAINPEPYSVWDVKAEIVENDEQ